MPGAGARSPVVGHEESEPDQPSQQRRADDAPQAVSLQPVDAPPPVTSHADDACRLEHVQVTGRRRPAVGEALGQVPGRQLGAVMGQDLDDVAPGFVSQRVEDDIDLRQRGKLRARPAPSGNHRHED